MTVAKTATTGNSAGGGRTFEAHASESLPDFLSDVAWVELNRSPPLREVETLKYGGCASSSLGDQRAEGRGYNDSWCNLLDEQ